MVGGLGFMKRRATGESAHHAGAGFLQVKYENSHTGQDGAKKKYPNGILTRQPETGGRLFFAETSERLEIQLVENLAPDRLI